MRTIIINALRSVVDPEVGFDVVALGLIYGVQRSDGGWLVQMTLSARSCPLHEMMLGWVKSVASEEVGEEVAVELVWEPAWCAAMCDESVRAAIS